MTGDIQLEGFQEDAHAALKTMIMEPLLANEAGAVVLLKAPTGSGKTVVAATVIAALATGAVALFLTEPLGLLPIPALAAVLIFSAWGLLDFAGIRKLKSIDRFEFGLSLLTTVGVLAIGVLPGVVIAILLWLASPVLLLLLRDTGRLLGQSLRVLAGDRTWLGYMDNPKQGLRLPQLRPGVFDLSLLLNGEPRMRSTNRVNALYAKDYSPLQDLALVWRGLRNFRRR